MALALCKLAVVIILLKSSEVLGQEDISSSNGCGGTNCSSNVCQDTGRSCCWCELADYAALQVCQCCPVGTFCCPFTPSPFTTNSPVCCPRGSTCYKNGCTRTDVIRARPSETVCSQCDPMNLSITADSSINELYVDGVLLSLSNANTWNSVDTIPIPADSRLIAARCSNIGLSVPAGLLASVPYDYLLTDASWKCTTRASRGWELPGFDDSSWLAAVVHDTNMGGGSHVQLTAISGSAKWIWTANNKDQRVYCRGYFPNDLCRAGYGNCSDLCAQRDKVCCGCEMMQTGPSKICSCCPKGHQCCNSPLSPFLPQRPATCCPVGYQCSRDGSSCTTNPVSVRPSEAEIDCGPCNGRPTGVDAETK